MDNTNNTTSSRTDTHPPCEETTVWGEGYLTSVEFLLPIITLGVLNIVVVFGNSLVILAVLTSHKLRTVTNMFIVSLAVADLLLGVVVLPFSSAKEVLHQVWVFGNIWCSIWLAVDVLLCTASILSLVAISLDRYLAISRPFRYPTLMSPMRGRILVAMVWVASFAICFPPLIGWNEGRKVMEISRDHPGNAKQVGNISSVYIVQMDASGQNVSSVYTLANNATHTGNETTTNCTGAFPMCELTQERGYIVYSALGSFYIPCAVLMFFYWRIYKIAVRTTKALKSGILTTKAGGEFSSQHGDELVTLRVHRGGGCNMKSSISDLGNSLSTSLLPDGKPASRKSSADSTYGQRVQTTYSAKQYRGSENTNGSSSEQKKRHSSAKIKLKKSPDYEFSLLGEDPPSPERHERLSPRLGNGRSGGPSSAQSETDCSVTTPLKVPQTNSARTSFSEETRGMKRNIKTHLRKLRRETKAAKTVGIIVGCFILCWLPFFTVYFFSGAFCENGLDCVHSILFSVFFWLGYCNSAVNPCVYALFSKDFRYAFKKLLCCRIEQRPPPRRTTGLVSFLSSIRIQISKNSDSNSE
eukprot:GHVU01183824.1.p1 GENE.GHVU01183824.1~~GHVU01183824.1.p1  ORF type:complete len:583 (+),score=13.33 GHVU01183824.1:535-2283(+)